MTDKPRLAFGYNAGLPADCEVAWGCRAIIEEWPAPCGGNGFNFHLDIPWDRKSVFGPAHDVERLTGILNIHFDTIIKAAEIALNDFVLDSTVAKEHVLWAGDGVSVVVNTNASHGYLYMCAFFQGESK